MWITQYNVMALGVTHVSLALLFMACGSRFFQSTCGACYLETTLPLLIHCRAVSAKAKRSLNYLRHSLWGATTATKSVAHKVLVRPLLEYTCQVWSRHTAHDIGLLEAVQCCATEMGMWQLMESIIQRVEQYI